MTAADVEPPWWTPRKTATPRRALSREAIVATALDVLRAEGMDAVSMRRVAADLGTGPASLYAHVAGKDELLDLLYDEVVGAVPLFEPDPARWKEQVTQLWSDCRAVLAGAGDIARYSLGRVPMGPNALRISELTMSVLRSGGVPDQAVAWAVDVVGMFVTANAVEDAVTADLARKGRDPQEYYDQVHRYFAGLPADRFPITAMLVPQLMTGTGDERFRFGLELLVGGLAALATEPRPTAAP
ncbi:MAG TPA: TetR/AcrR family transcriptional regulator [Pseudonocardia sp.]|jgi:AcrR family transcriptional regulator|nr:TetR/AcrR family transcriptional regulator [Pseudonocardia sp.]